jgi:acetyltransferase-like isoleucine patch superfamily enzyme
VVPRLNLVGLTRALASPVINLLWQQVERFGAIAPGDPRARRFRRLGEASLIAFPPGPLFGRHWVGIGSGVLIAPHVTISVGLPGEEMDRDAPVVVEIGDRSSIGRGSALVGRVGIVIEDDVMLGPNVYVTDHNHAYRDVSVPIREQMPEEAPVRIGAGSWLGANVVVLPGTDIGRHVTVAAGSVVRGQVPDFSVVAGVPARVVAQADADGRWTRSRAHSIPQPISTITAPAPASNQ